MRPDFSANEGGPRGDHAVGLGAQAHQAGHDDRRVALNLVFDKITFTPEKTLDGPRYRLDGSGDLGRLLGLDDDAKGASPAGVEPALAT